MPLHGPDLDERVERSISELVAEEEFTPKPEPLARINLIEKALDRSRERREEMRAEDALLRSYPLEDHFDDGTVLIWHSNDGEDEYMDKHFAAVKDLGRWTITGEWRTFVWDDLVVSRLRGWDWSEVEVVHPAQSQ